MYDESLSQGMLLRDLLMAVVHSVRSLLAATVPTVTHLALWLCVVPVIMRIAWRALVEMDSAPLAGYLADPSKCVRIAEKRPCALPSGVDGPEAVSAFSPLTPQPHAYRQLLWDWVTASFVIINLFLVVGALLVLLDHLRWYGLRFPDVSGSTGR